MAAAAAEAEGEKRLALLPFLCGGQPPHPGEEALPFLALGGGRSGELASGQGEQGAEYFPVRPRPIFPQGGQSFVPKQHIGVGVFPRRLRRQAADDGLFQHPAAEVAAHVPFADAGIQVADLKFPQLPQAVLRVRSADVVQQLIDVDIGQGGGDGPELPPAQGRPPGEVAPQLFQPQVVVAGVIEAYFPVPGGVVLVILHELALHIEVFAGLPEGMGAVFIEPPHLPQLFRYSGGFPALSGQGRVPIGRLPPFGAQGEGVHQGFRGIHGLLDQALEGQLFRLRFLRGLSAGAGSGRGQGRIVVVPVLYPVFAPQGDGVAPGLPGFHSLVKEAEHRLPLRPVVKTDAHPVRPLHMDGGGQPGLGKAPQRSVAAFQIAELDLLSPLSVPPAQQHRRRFPGIGIAQLRDAQLAAAGKLPFPELFADMVFFLGVGRQLRNVHRLPS